MLLINKLLFSVACALVLTSAIVQGAQVVTPTDPAQSGSGQIVTQGATVSVEVEYNVTAPQTGDETGLGLRMHFDSSALTLDDIPDNTVLKNTISVGGTTMQDLQPTRDDLGSIAVQDDTEDYDNDPATDKRVIIAWVDANGQWPLGQSLPHILFSTTFTADIPGGGGAVGDTVVRFTASSTSSAAGTPADFTATPAAICINGLGGNDCGATPPIPGDADGSGFVNIFDVLLLLNHINDPASAVAPGGDCIQDGIINIFDVLCTLNHI